MAHAVALKLPEVWTDNVEAWFAQAESQFQLRDITREDTKYHYVVASLNAVTAKRFNVFLSSPLSATPYSDLKNRLFSKFSKTPFERAAAINAITGLGDWKPSELMDHLLSILSNHKPDLMSQFHFFQCLPDYVRATLSSSQTTNVHELAEEADRIFVAGRPRDASIHEAAVEPSVDRVTAARPPARRAKHRAAQNNNSRTCWYHARFGDDALSCQAPCDWPSTPGNAARGLRQ
jgi:hypothetical protein